MVPRLLPAGLAAGVLVLLACPGGSNPNQKDPPQVTLTITDSNAVGDHLDLIVNAVGCNKVTQATIRNSGSVIKAFDFTSSPTHVALAVTDIPWSKVGIGGTMALSAGIVCDDGRSNTSQEMGASLFPVTQVITPGSGGGSVVPTQFYAEGSGSSVSFVGCVGEPGGSNGIARVDVNGNVLKNNGLTNQTPCGVTTWFSGATVDDTRWMVTPNVGAMAFDTDLSCTAIVAWNNPASGLMPLAVQYLGVGPDGDAMISELGGPNVDGEGGYDLWRINHRGGCSKNTVDWAVSETGAQGNPVISEPDHVVTQMVVAESQTQGSYSIEACRTDYNDTQTAADSGVYNPPVCHNFTTVTTSESPPALGVGLSTDGQRGYVPMPSADGAHFSVYAAKTNNGADLWSNAPQLDGQPNFALPYANNTLVAAIGATDVYFLSAADGTIQNASAAPITPAGGLTTQYALTSGTGTDFYLLSGTAGSLPSEVVGVDSPELGELFRYRVGTTSSLFLGMDDSGTVWMRYGDNLAQLYSPAQYRALLGE